MNNEDFNPAMFDDIYNGLPEVAVSPVGIPVRDTPFFSHAATATSTADVKLATPDAVADEREQRNAEDFVRAVETQMTTTRSPEMKRRLQELLEFHYRGELVKEQTATPWRTLANAYTERSPLVYRVENLLLEASLNVVYSAPGCLKSMWLADMALDVAMGRAHLQALPTVTGVYPFATTQSPVAWIDFDNGTRRTDERFDALGRARRAPSDTPLFYKSMSVPRFNAGDVDDASRFADDVAELNAGLTVVDNLGQISGGADENSADMVVVMANLRWIAEQTKTALVVVHHQRKSSGTTRGGRQGDTLRGHSSVEASLDLALLVERPDERADDIVIRSTKSRDMHVFPFAARFTYEHKVGSREMTEAKFYGVELPAGNDDDGVKTLVAKVVGQGDGVSAAELIAEVRRVKPSYTAKTIRKCANELVEEGTIRAETRAHNKFVYLPE